MKLKELVGLGIVGLAFFLVGCTAPTADFWWEPYRPMVGEVVTFDGSTSIDGGGPDNDDEFLSSYTWDFGDGVEKQFSQRKGNLQEGKQITHIYSAPGDYDVSLTVCDWRPWLPVRCDTLTRTITVLPLPQPPVASFTAFPQSGEAPLSVYFDGSSSYDPDGEIVSYHWDFGDSNFGTGEFTSHTYHQEGRYTVVLRVTDDDGATDTDSIVITVSPPEPINLPPVANAQAQPTQGEAPLKVYFDGSISHDPDGTIVAWQWDFSDGSTSHEISPVHTYTQPGSYRVTLTVTDNDGAKDTDTVMITVLEPEPNLPPVAKIREPQDGSRFEVGEEIRFDGSSSYDPDGEIVSYHWDFGDSNFGTGKIASHTYHNKGRYTVLLTVTDNEGAKDTDSVRIVIIEKPPPPSPPTLYVSLTAQPSAGVAPLTVDLIVVVSGTATGLIRYQLDCTSDGIWEREIITDSETYTAEQLCTYHQPGEYSAKVRVERQGLIVEGTSTIVIVSP